MYEREELHTEVLSWQINESNRLVAVRIGFNQ